MNILNSVNTAATINKIIHNAQGTTTTTEGATAAGKIIKENLPDIISAGFDMPRPTSIFEGVPPFSFISNGDPLINWSIYGNTVEGVSVGDRTNNLFNDFDIIGRVPSTSSGELVNIGNGACTDLIEVSEALLTMSIYESIIAYIFLYDVNQDFIGWKNITSEGNITTDLITDYENTKYVRLRTDTYSQYLINKKIMLNTGDTALPFEPYGYKIPVTCGGVTTNIYIDEPLTAGETISYNDTGVIIPTTMFLNTLSVDTTVQPEKVFIEYVK